MILDLCGGSGAWSAPYAAAGESVLIVDPVCGTGDVREFRAVRGQARGILAAPPCTVFSYVRNRYPPTRRELAEALSVVRACLRIIREVRPDWWALENPVNKLRAFMPFAPTLVFRQWEYGDPGEKPTAIYGRFAIPMKTHDRRAHVAPARHWSKRWTEPSSAVTPPGFARAFWKANP